jgi:hypothetical protein
MKRKCVEIRNELDINSLIESIELMNCLNGEDEYRILKESSDLRFKINDLDLNEIKEILKKTYKRYKRYIEHVNLDELYEIEKRLYKFIRLYRNETDLNNLLYKYKQLIDIMFETDMVILNELHKNPSTAKRYKSYK